MGSKYSYRFTDKAEGDLDGILDYITNGLCNPKAAADFYVELFKVIEDIRAFPAAGAATDNEYISDETVRKITVGNYVVFYKPVEVETIVYIIRIIYGRRDLTNILKDDIKEIDF